MFSRMLTPPLLVAAAVGVPYVATNGPNIDELWKQGAALTTSSQPAAEQAVEPQATTATSQAALNPQSRLAVVSLQEAFRMDVSKEWVYQRWQRKSTALSELGLYGVRVSLISGTQLHDVAGALTYYFGRDSRVQRISFRGRTADTSQIINIARHYGLQPQHTPIVGEQLFQVRRDQQVFSELRTRPEHILRTSSLRESFLVNLELQRPDATTPLPANLPPALAGTDPQQAAAQSAAAAEQTAAADESESEEKKDPLKAYFPRSRVPAGQIESLERRDRFW